MPTSAPHTHTNAQTCPQHATQRTLHHFKFLIIRGHRNPTGFRDTYSISTIEPHFSSFIFVGENWCTNLPQWPCGGAPSGVSVGLGTEFRLSGLVPGCCTSAPFHQGPISAASLASATHWAPRLASSHMLSML